MPGRAGNAFSGVAVAAIPGLGDAAAGDGPSEVAGVASGEGGTTEVSRTSPDPTASAPPTSRASDQCGRHQQCDLSPTCGSASTSDSIARRVAARHSGLPATRLRRRRLASPSSRRSTSLQISGTGTRSSVANRWRRSSIVITKKLTETTPAATQVGADRQAVRPEAGRDVPDREVGVVEEDHCRTLGVGQQAKRREEVRIAVPVEVFSGSGGHRDLPHRALSALLRRSGTRYAMSRQPGHGRPRLG